MLKKHKKCKNNYFLTLNSFFSIKYHLFVETSFLIVEFCMKYLVWTHTKTVSARKKHPTKKLDVCWNPFLSETVFPGRDDFMQWDKKFGVLLCNQTKKVWGN